MGRRRWFDNGGRRIKARTYEVVGTTWMDPGSFEFVDALARDQRRSGRLLRDIIVCFSASRGVEVKRTLDWLQACYELDSETPEQEASDLRTEYLRVCDQFDAATKEKTRKRR